MTPDRLDEIRQILDAPKRPGGWWYLQPGDHQNIAEELFAEVDRLRDALTWRGGVPCDCRPVLASVRDGRQSFVLRASYVRRYEVEAGESEEEQNVEYRDDDEDTAYCPEGWYEANEYEECHCRLDGEVVAWMPLPRPAKCHE